MLCIIQVDTMNVYFKYTRKYLDGMYKPLIMNTLGWNS